ncbi:MAG: peptidoglycan DD-metalloendopeptidase family protein [Patescibacteria group bacterium]
MFIKLTKIHPTIVGYVLVSLILTLFLFIGGRSADAETLQDLKQAIEERNQEIQRLEAEAKKFREEIAVQHGRAKTLSGELTRIDRLIKGLKNDITLTERRISVKTLEIGALGGEIQEKNAAVGRLQTGLGAALRAVSHRDREPMALTLAKRKRLSDLLQEFDQFEMLETKILGSVAQLRELREELEMKKGAAEEKKSELEDLKFQLRDRTAIQEGEKRGRADLLTVTKSQEKKYQNLLHEYEAKRAALEDEIRGIEEKIRITIDPSLLPSRGAGVLASPLPKAVLAPCATSMKADPLTNCLTQRFGYTSFAAAGGYNGNGHNGVDFRAEVGTPVSAAEAGVVAAVGDTDIGCRRASYGKWILVRHPNNLTTLYAHLSAVGVSAGDAVERDARIGYTGMTGYATGPHLHFSVLATQGARVENIRSRVCGTTMTVPIAAVNAYLNPLDYL